MVLLRNICLWDTHFRRGWVDGEMEAITIHQLYSYLSFIFLVSSFLSHVTDLIVINMYIIPGIYLIVLFL